MSFYQTNGNNNFKDHTYNYREWSAQVMSDKNEVIEQFNKLKLIGRTIEDLRVIGMGYNWGEAQLYDWIYNVTSWQFGDVETSDDDILVRDGLEIDRWAEIDKPLLIKFTDGDILAVSCPLEGAVRMDLNNIPWGIKPGINQETFYANVLFKDMIGKQLTSFRVTLKEELEEIDSIYFGYGSEGECANKELRFYVEDFSYGQLELQENGKAMIVESEEIPKIVNWDILENLHEIDMYLNSEEKNGVDHNG